jgi:general stress protein 26
MSDKELTHAEKIEKLGKLIQDVKVAMMTTVAPNGTMHSRPMWTQEAEFDGTLWFFTGKSGEKVAHLNANPRVNLGYAKTGDNTYVSVSGTAHLSFDREKMKELWNPFMKAWFEDGLDDPDLALLHVRVESAEYWDNPNSKLYTLISFVKASLTGETAYLGENEEVQVR